MTVKNTNGMTEINIGALLTLLVWTTGEHEEVHLYRPNGALGAGEQGVVHETRRLYGVTHKRAVVEGLLMAANLMINEAS